MDSSQNQENKPTVTNKVKAKFDKAEKVFLISNVLMTLIFTAHSILNMIDGFGKGVIQYVTLGLLAAYVVAFIVLVVLFNKDKASLKNNMQNYKFAIKFMKKIVGLMNLAIALTITYEAAMIDELNINKVFALIAGIMGIVFAVFKFILFIWKFARKKKKAKKKAEKKVARDAKIENTKKRIKSLLGKEDRSTEIAISGDDDFDPNEK